MSTTVTLTGFDKFLTICDPARFTKEMDATVQKGAHALRDGIKKMPPVNSERTGYAAKGVPVAPRYGGTFRQSISDRRAGLMAADVFVGPAAEAYGTFVIDGTAKMPGRDVYQWELEDFGGLKILDTLVRDALLRVVTP